MNGRILLTEFLRRARRLSSFQAVERLRRRRGRQCHRRSSGRLGECGRSAESVAFRHCLTIDGFGLNELRFLTGVAAGLPLLRTMA